MIVMRIRILGMILQDHISSFTWDYDSMKLKSMADPCHAQALCDHALILDTYIS
jgi:hypothetical protein